MLVFSTLPLTAYIRSCSVQFNFNPVLLEWREDFLMAYYKAKLKSNGDKALLVPDFVSI
jgi:hypothetical protein